MVFKYAGNLPEVQEVVELNRDKINWVYHNILGSERYEKVKEISDRVIASEGIYEDSELFCRDIRIPIEVGQSFKNPMHIFVHEVDLKEDSDEIESCSVSSFFYLPRSAFLNSPYRTMNGGPDYLFTYLHEFNHFVYSALQSPPASFVASEGLMVEDISIKDYGDFSELMEIVDSNSDLSPLEKKTEVDSIIAEFYVELYQEQGTRILDEFVINHFGLSFNHPWRNRKMNYFSRTPIGFLDPYFFPVPDVDLFCGIGNRDVFERVINWQDNFKLPFSSPAVDEIFEESKSVPTHYISPEEYLKLREGVLVEEVGNDK